MFSPKIIAEKMKKVAATQGIILREYPVEHCIRIYDEFKRLEGEDGGYARPDAGEGEVFAYTEEEKLFIRNELLMSTISFPYWYYRYFFIKPPDGRVRRPEPLIAQEVFLDVLADLDERGLPKLLMFLKARQLGISTMAEGVILWIALFVKGSHNAIASAREENSVKMSDMVWNGLDHLPLWMRPKLLRNNRKRGPAFAEINTDINIQHGAQTAGIGRGDTITACHLSEVAFYPDPVGTIDSSVLRAIHENRRTFLVLESTAKTKDDWFHRTWKYNKEQTPKGLNKFTCVFLPWFVGSDKYPTYDWLRNHPIPAGWTPLKVTVDQAARAELYVSLTPVLRKHFGLIWKMPLAQQWYWEFSYLEAQVDPEKARSFPAEMASDDETCFQSVNWSVYAKETLERVRGGLAEKWVDYAFSGSGIEPKFHLTQWHDPSAPPIKIQWTNTEGEVRKWTLTPLRATPDTWEESFYLRVWEAPQPRFNYAIGVDISGGGGRDNTSADVLRVGKDGGPDIQVAQLYCPFISSNEIPAFIHALGTWYGRYMEPLAEAYLVPETQIATGDRITWELPKEGYTNFHRMNRYDSANPGLSNRLGWITYGSSRQMMLDAEKIAIENGWLHVNSEHTLRELEGQEGEETDAGKTRYDHSSSSHDDSIFSLGMAYFTSHDGDTLSMRQAGRKPTAVPKLDTGDERVRLSGRALMQMQFRIGERVMRAEEEGEGLEYVY